LNWKFWLGIVIGALFLFLAFRGIEFQELKNALRQANYFLLIPASLMTVLSVWVRAYRWHYILQPVQKIRMNSLFSATMIGLMANNIFPARLGEFVRAYVIGEKESISKSASFATIILERILDGITVLLFLSVVLIFYSFSLPDWMSNAAYIASGFYLFALAFLILLKVKTEKVLHFVRFVSKPLPHKIGDGFIHLLNSFITGLQILHNMRNIIMASILSLFVWLPIGFIIHLLLNSFGIHLPIYASFFLLVILCIGVMIPSAPGFVGTIQFVCVAVLAMFGVIKSQALSFSFLFHATQFIPVTLLGLIFFFAEGFTFSQIGRSSRVLQNSDEG